MIRAGRGPTLIFILFQTFLDVVRLTHVIYMSQFHRTKHIFVFVGQGAVQEVILAYVDLEPNGTTGSFHWGFSTVGLFKCSNTMTSCSGTAVGLRPTHIDPWNLHTGSLLLFSFAG